jgi:hypothetical protein
MELQQDEEGATAIKLPAPTPKKILGTTPKVKPPSTMQGVQIHTISSSSSEEEVSNKTDSSSKVVDDYEVDYGKFADIPKQENRQFINQK